MKSCRRIVSGLALAGLAACAQPAPPPASQVAPPRLSADQIDGIYRGTSTRYQADSRACPSPGLVVLRVVNGVFLYRWNGRTQVDATVAPSGDVQGALGTISLSGKLNDGRIEGDIANETCAYHFRAVKRTR
jgi:hypothetical protein